MCWSFFFSFFFCSGHSQSRTESYVEKVVTHREKEAFQFSRCQETAPPDINLDGARATRVRNRNLGRTTEGRRVLVEGYNIGQGNDEDLDGGYVLT